MSARFTIDGSAAGAVKAVESLTKALDATEKEAEGVTKATKAMQAAAVRIKEAEDPQLKYNNRLKEMQKLYDSGLISLTQLDNRTEHYRKQMLAAGDAG